jgi:hypothetical protein
MEYLECVPLEEPDFQQEGIDQELLEEVYRLNVEGNVVQNRKSYNPEALIRKSD